MNKKTEKIIKGKKYRVVEDDQNMFSSGTIVVALENSELTSCPYFIPVEMYIYDDVNLYQPDMPEWKEMWPLWVEEVEELECENYDDV